MTKNLNHLRTLHIAATGDTPEVYLSVSEPSALTGRSLPENAFNFYHSIVEWVKQFVASDNKEFVLILHFDYFNSSSGRYIYEILNLLDNSHHKNHYTIIWKYEADDDLMIERGEAFQSLCSIPFNFVEVGKE